MHFPTLARRTTAAVAISTIAALGAVVADPMTAARASDTCINVGKPSRLYYGSVYVGYLSMVYCYGARTVRADFTADGANIYPVLHEVTAIIERWSDGAVARSAPSDGSKVSTGSLSIDVAPDQTKKWFSASASVWMDTCRPEYMWTNEHNFANGNETPSVYDLHCAVS
ncbi:hypothetical protein [Nonomuraea sediminis]|uniref:hypothetical protein n=1 Tax=Nonomuraea sediminis TaxID=2835864 RepID=UPI001BDCA405|nr:hypothetical protein [Nonomuraea sediminis]